MSDFKVEVTRILDVIQHHNADSLSIYKVFDFNCIDKKGRFKKGDLVVYVPVDSVLPSKMVEDLGLKDSRIKAIRLRGVFSEGLILPVTGDKFVGDDLTEALGITKYQPIRKHERFMDGVMLTKRLDNSKGIHVDKCVNYDLSNYKKERNRLVNSGKLVDGETMITLTEKIHGTFCQIVVWPEDVFEGQPYPWLGVTSKGRAKSGFLLEQSASNYYVDAAMKYIDVLKDVHESAVKNNSAVFILGEVFGPGVQDLSYTDQLDFRVFDIGVVPMDEERHTDTYADPYFMPRSTLTEAVHGFPVVPVLYHGPYNHDLVLEYCQGKTTLDKDHIREGVVLTVDEPLVPFSERIILKVINPDYLLRKKGTDYQ